MSGNPAQEQHQPHLCGCWSPRTPRYSPNTSRSWRRRVSETTLSSSTNCWMSSWTSASHRPQTAKSCRSEWAVGGGNLGRVGRVSLGLSAHLPAGCARYITQQGNKLETGKSRVPPTVTNAVSWRSEGIKYKKNEVFIDVIESVNLLVSLHTSAPPSLQPRAGRGSPVLVNRLPHHQCLHPQVNANGSVLLSEIVGSIKLKVFLSGMPELRLGLNDRVLFELTGRKFLEGGARGSLRPRLICGEWYPETCSQF